MDWKLVERSPRSATCKELIISLCGFMGGIQERTPRRLSDLAASVTTSVGDAGCQVTRTARTEPSAPTGYEFIFFPFLSNNERPRAAVQQIWMEKLKKCAHRQIVNVTWIPQCLMEWYASAPKLPACNMTKKSANSGMKLLWTGKHQHFVLYDIILEKRKQLLSVSH